MLYHLINSPFYSFTLSIMPTSYPTGKVTHEVVLPKLRWVHLMNVDTPCYFFCTFLPEVYISLCHMLIACNTDDAIVKRASCSFSLLEHSCSHTQHLFTLPHPFLGGQLLQEFQTMGWMETGTLWSAFNCSHVVCCICASTVAYIVLSNSYGTKPDD